MLFARVAQTSAEVARTSGRKKKTELIAQLLRDVPVDERAICARHLSGEVGHKLGIGYVTVFSMKDTVAPVADDAASLTLADVDKRFAAIAALSGTGSQKARKDQLGALLAKATQLEQEFLGAIVLGELRQGALDALVVEGLALATAQPAGKVRAAYMLAGDIGVVAAAVLADGAAGLDRFGLMVFRPVLPMLAQTAESASDALATFAGPAALELKLDGFRVQLHKDGDVVRGYSRNLNEVTHMIPELVALTKAFPARRAILDGEAIALGVGGRPLPFQDTMRRFGKRADLVATLPLSLKLFDALLIDDQTLLATPAGERFAALDALAPRSAVPRMITNDAAEATAFYDKAIADGHEGVMAKSLDATYDAGNRGAAWLKIKHVHRLDLVVLAVEWGSGRRKGLLSNLHLGARSSDGFVMVSKTFKGMTDAILAWQTKALLEREVDRDGHVVYVKPELVVEIAFNDVLRSSEYKGGVALRFARLVRYRDDKTADQADTIETIRAIAIKSGALR
ncbi:MAG: ATP-dependent DNA ligase [Kofleriaceae bacterium]